MPVSDYTPAVADVAAIIRARTKTAGGAEAGTFNPADAPEQDRTRPTAEGVQSIINSTIGDLTAAFGADIPDAPGDDPALYRTGVRQLAALGAALDVELTYFPEQVATGRSPYAQMKTRYDDRLKRLTGVIFPSSSGGDGGGGLGAQVPSPSAGGFPTTAIGMEQDW